MSTHSAPARRHTGTWLIRVMLGMSFALCLGVAFCYAVRPDACAAVTVFPVWVWLLPGFALTILGWGRSWRRITAVIVLCWLTYLLVFAEEPRSLLRARQWSAPLPAVAQDDDVLRVVTLNCCLCSEQAARAVLAFDPDIVLLQETPMPPVVERLARELYGAQAGWYTFCDTAILARGAVTPVNARPSQEELFFTHARVRLTSGQRLEVVSAHLLPPFLRLDLWSPECWDAQTFNRRARHSEVRRLCRRLATIPDTMPLIVGGDFNAPAGDAVYRPFRPRLRDTFHEAGMGWGNTIWNDTPVLRIDQVWVSRHFRVLRVITRSVAASDHRMVVCDLQVRH
jgi:endonuclease/exonuclease/phosphatase family metal-dependent hydrolase